jgi:uncharacterized coiled-coil protein SlyX
MNLFRSKDHDFTNQTFNEPALPLVALVLACFALSPTAQGVLPAPDGGYPGSNTAEGTDALFNLTIGTSNTAIGFDALFSNMTGNANTAVGSLALFRNTQGSSNTATGVNALKSNTAGDANTATGHEALLNNTTGFGNTANGSSALKSNTTGRINVAMGFDALFHNTTGNGNTANGPSALFNNTTGTENTADGLNALVNNTTGNQNIALGVEAGENLTTGSNNIDIGNAGVFGDANTIRIGTQGTQTKTFIAGVNGAAVMGAAVKVNAAGQIGTAPSAARFKEEIKPMDKASETIHALKPVTFRYKKEIDTDGIPQFGLVAEEVEKVNPALVARDAEGKVYTVRYEAVNAMLLNEFLKEHRTVQELKSIVAKQEAIIAQQQKGMEAVTARLEEQDSKIQKVSAQVELTKPAPRTVSNNQ